jgi:Rrf2 family transcriptional regulator, iron-sulfur cluster assembly transcription factor
MYDSSCSCFQYSASCSPGRSDEKNASRTNAGLAMTGRRPNATKTTAACFVCSCSLHVRGPRERSGVHQPAPISRPPRRSFQWTFLSIYRRVDRIRNSRVSSPAAGLLPDHLSKAVIRHVGSPGERQPGMATFLSQTSEYALRAMAWIATRQSEKAIRARDLSDATQIPHQYLSKILRRLVRARLLKSRKGRGGGFALARPAGEIRIRDVLVSMDAYPDESRCAFGWGTCDARRPCPLHGLWSEISEGFHAWASRATLAGARSTAARARGAHRPGRPPRRPYPKGPSTRERMGRLRRHPGGS